jgi:hypothetical protein
MNHVKQLQRQLPCHRGLDQTHQAQAVAQAYKPQGHLYKITALAVAHKQHQAAVQIHQQLEATA